MAGSNRFDQATPQSYVSQYAQMPLNYIGSMAKDYTNKYNKVQEDAYGLNDLMANVHAIDQHAPIKKALDEYYHPKINELADKIAKGTDLVEARRDINKIQREFINDPRRQELEKSYMDYNKDIKDMTELKSKGLYTDVYNPFNGFKGITQDGQIEPYRYKGSRPVQDYLKVGSELMKDIAKSGGSGKSYKIDGSGNVIGLENGWEAVYAKDVERVAKKSIDPFLKSKEGEYFIDELKFSNPNITENEILNKSYDYLNRLGNKQIFKDTESGTSFNYAPGYIHQEQAANLTTSSQSEGMNNSVIDNPIMKGMEFDSKGNLKIPDETGFKNTGTSQGSTGVMGASGITSSKGKDLNKMAEQISYIKSLQDTHPDLKGLNPKQTIDAITKATQSVHNESIPLESISNVAAKNIGDAIVRNKAQRNFYLYDSKGKTEDGTLETVLKKLDIKEEDFDKALKDGIGGYTQAGPSAGGYYVEVKDDNGQARRVVISPDEEMKQIFRTSQAVNEQRKTLQPGVIQPFQDTPNYKISIKPTVRKDGTADWQYTEILTDNNGNITHSSPTTLDEIRKAEKEHLKKSGYLGTNLGVLKDNTTE